MEYIWYGGRIEARVKSTLVFYLDDVKGEFSAFDLSDSDIELAAALRLSNIPYSQRKEEKERESRESKVRGRESVLKPRPRDLPRLYSLRGYYPKILLTYTRNVPTSSSRATTSNLAFSLPVKKSRKERDKEI